MSNGPRDLDLVGEETSIMGKIYTAEAVTSGHPDKVCDIIADTLLDAYLEKDQNARVAIEVSIHKNKVWVMGEVTSSAQIPVEKIVRETLIAIGYDRDELGTNGFSATIQIDLDEQSPDIALAFQKEIGAGDQGIMIGYATKETKNLMPLPIVLSHLLCERLDRVRKERILPYLRPDGKVQVSIEYEGNIPKRIGTLILSAQHDPDISLSKLREDIQKEVLFKVVEKWMDEKTKIYINPTGRFVLGGPYADSGLTGRKIMVDSYGPYIHGGGAFSGKDPTKVDRSAAYYARYVAKNIVAHNLADTCKIEVSYAIGLSKPLSITVDTFGTHKVPIEKINQIIDQNFCFTPASMIKELQLKNPIYKKTAYHGHFGHDFPWEKIIPIKTHN